MRIFPTRKKMISAFPNGGVVAEVGVQIGHFSHQILRKARPSKLHLIDCWEEHHEELHYPHDGCPGDQAEHNSNYEVVQQRFAEQIAQGQVEMHRGYSAPMLATLPDNYLDWAFIDANHSYSAVCEDLAAALPKMKPGGVISGHDYINTPHWNDLNYGVVEAVDEFCDREGWEMIAKTPGPGWDVDETDNPSFAIRQQGLKPLWHAWEAFLPFVVRRAA
jgi:hypothetical protein